MKQFGDLENVVFTWFWSAKCDFYTAGKTGTYYDDLFNQSNWFHFDLPQTATISPAVGQEAVTFKVS